MSAEVLWASYEAISSQPLMSSFCTVRPHSSIMSELAEQLEAVSVRDEMPVLIIGETGVGKACFAMEIRARSGRAGDALVTMACIGTGADALELALLGAPLANGDVTGSSSSPPAGADGGTIFLHEIGALDADLQERIQGLMATGRYVTTSDEEVRVDVRVLASSSLDLVDEVNEGRFREDLYYRFSAMSVVVPPVRAREDDDVIELIDHVARSLARELLRSPSRLTSQSLHRLVRYPWPGNVREIRNVRERAMVSARGSAAIELSHLPPEVRDPLGFDGEYVPRTLAELERLHIERTLRRHRQNRTHAANELGISRATLIKKIREYGEADASGERGEVAG